MRCLAFMAAKWEFQPLATHIKGTDNTLADALSRDNLIAFRSLHPQAEERPTALPAAMLDLILLREPDWTSRNWTEHPGIGQNSGVSTFRMA